MFKLKAVLKNNRHYPFRILTISDVLQELNGCHEFGWSWCKLKDEAYNRVASAIVIYLDNNPRFVIRFGPVKGCTYLSTLINCEGEILLSRFRHDIIEELYSPLEKISLDTNWGKEETKMRIIFFKESFEFQNYNVMYSNCVTYVRYIIDEALKNWGLTTKLPIQENAQLKTKKKKKIKSKENNIFLEIQNISSSLGATAMVIKKDSISLKNKSSKKEAKINMPSLM